MQLPHVDTFLLSHKDLGTDISEIENIESILEETFHLEFEVKDGEEFFVTFVSITGQRTKIKTNNAMTIQQLIALFTVNEGFDKYNGYYYKGKRILNGTVKGNKIRRGAVINVGKRLQGGAASQVFIRLPFALKNNLNHLLLRLDLSNQ